MRANLFSNKDDKILHVIFETIGDYPDELKYQRLTAKHLSKIFNNPVLALDLLCKFGFEYSVNKKYLQFIGIATEIYHLLHEETISFVVKQCILRACFRVDKDTRETFDSNIKSFGVFYISNTMTTNMHIT